MSDDEIFDYYLWHPRRVGPASFAIDITPGEKWNSPEPSVQFLECFGRRLHLPSKIISSQLTPFRTTYYSDPDVEDWEDVWRIGWQLKFDLESGLPSLPGWQNEYLGFVGYDASTFSASAPRLVSCIVCADTAASSNYADIRVALKGDPDLAELRRSYGAANPSVKRYAVWEKCDQIRIDLGTFDEAFFRNGAQYGQRVQELCRQAGAYTDFETRSLEYDEFFDDDGIV